jgi:endonuclease YncB( thermonuclease family)
MRHGVAQRGLSPLLLALALAAACSWPSAAAGDCTTPPKPARLAPATVERVSDGDTVVLRFVLARHLLPSVPGQTRTTRR